MNTEAALTVPGPSLAQVLELRQTGDDTFMGDSAPGRNNHIFGGQLLAQAVVAADATVPDMRAAHSTHAYSCVPVTRRVRSNIRSSACATDARSRSERWRPCRTPGFS